MNRAFAALVLVSLAACAQAERARCVESSGRLPSPVTNNAVAFLENENGGAFYSFMGLGYGKTFRDVTSSAAVCNAVTFVCRGLPDVPVGEGRLAAVAVGIKDRVFLFGGYAVAENGDEISTPQVFVFDPQTQNYQRSIGSINPLFTENRPGPPWPPRSNPAISR